MTYPESALDIARSMVPRMEWTCPRSWSGPPDEYACAEPCPDPPPDVVWHSNNPVGKETP